MEEGRDRTAPAGSAPRPEPDWWAQEPGLVCEVWPEGMEWLSQWSQDALSLKGGWFHGLQVNDDTADAVYAFTLAPPSPHGVDSHLSACCFVVTGRLLQLQASHLPMTVIHAGKVRREAKAFLLL